MNVTGKSRQLSCIVNIYSYAERFIKSGIASSILVVHIVTRS